MTYVHTVLLNFQITVDNQIFKISEKSSENPKSILGSHYVIGLLFVLKEALDEVFLKPSSRYIVMIEDPIKIGYCTPKCA